MNKNLITFALAGLSLAGCVTINIYFPAAATEKAADKIIDEVWQIQKSEQIKNEQPKGNEVKPADTNIQKETK